MSLSRYSVEWPKRSFTTATIPPWKRRRTLSTDTSKIGTRIFRSVQNEPATKSGARSECRASFRKPIIAKIRCYFLWNDDGQEWIAPLPLTMAILYAVMARAELALRPSDRRILAVTAGTALTFVTLAIPVQLDSNWITDR